MKKGTLLAKFLFLSGEAKGKKRKNTKNDKEGKTIDSKEEYFIKNGGILLEKRIALSQGKAIGAEQLKILPEDEIEKVTNKYDPALIVRSYRGASFYKGTFDDLVVVTRIPENLEPNPELVDLFLTDVAIRTVLCHSNMIKIYGCCLEMCVPITLHEVHPCRALYEQLHGDMTLQRLLTWTKRLSVATDIAYVLSYMHNALSQPVVHRDIMSMGIYIDSSFHAKLTFCGFSVAINPGNKDQRWPVHGTPGYIDPEYIKTLKVTDKCDVYSLGVLMLELITSRDPFEMAQRGTDLVDEFVSMVESNGVEAMVDATVMAEARMDEMQRFAQLALRCVAKKGDQRPSMINVVEELWLIQHQVKNRSA